MPVGDAGIAGITDGGERSSRQVCPEPGVQGRWLEAEPRPAGTRAARGRRDRRESLEEQARRRGVRPVISIEDMARDDVFESDEELNFESDEELNDFLAHVHAERQANPT